MSFINNEDVGWYYDVIQSIVLTEKSTRLKESENKLTINVARKFSKKQIRYAFEKIFNIKVLDLNILNIKGKSVNFKGFRGKKIDIKKAILTIPNAKNFEFNL
ncbi:Large ribosomal subunit protein uL23 [Candidatus Xenohaliotis californiensis]|uniref:Large ribosomal subunit protein uL23 n=1 Tax=Candidatus Xenohaliotis californiensis TaxID=84677 RepID=A0ABP0EVI8_9RICK|nr:Large ribosomal subunit protein uL23 [Candidatus Xenohaliotis californiensis]